MPNITLTLEAACKILRSYGIKANNTRLADMIESGAMPIGTVVNVSNTGRRQFLIFAKDLIAFCESKLV